jgi:hypothetical protein
VSMKRDLARRSAARLGGVLLVLLGLTFVLSPTVASNSSAASVKPCQGRNLIGGKASSSVYAGGAIIVLAITNIGPSACELGGYARLLGIRQGHEYKIPDVVRGPTQAGQLETAILIPREAGALIFDTSLGCNANVYPPPVATDYTGVVLLLPDREGLVKVLGVPLSMPCGVSESRLGWAKGFELHQ